MNLYLIQYRIVTPNVTLSDVVRWIVIAIHKQIDVVWRVNRNLFPLLFEYIECVLVITAVLPYRMCSIDQQCGKNMVCLSGLCECARQDFIPARNKRECSKNKLKALWMHCDCLVAVPYLSVGSTCLDSPYGCCSDNMTVSPSSDRRGCPGISFHLQSRRKLLGSE